VLKILFKNYKNPIEEKINNYLFEKNRENLEKFSGLK
jgi:hypothetical protein